MSTSNDNSYYTLENGIEKSINDDRIYDHFQLDNGLNVVNITDKDTDKAYVCMSVGVGSIYDPKDVPGLAHFVEHLLFMGSKKHPEENAYNDFLSKNNGSSNAYTSQENTNFFFAVDNKALFDTLTIFSEFFTCPLFLESCVNRELKAVDNEHSKNLQSDVWRNSQILKHLCRPEHPLHHFSTGDITTLSLPDIRDRAMAFHHQYYVPTRMQLVILSSYTLAELHDHIETLFASMEKREFTPLEMSNSIYAPETMNALYQVIPVGDVKKIRFNFPLPSQMHDTVKNSLSFLSFLLGHEGKGSIIVELRKQGLATDLEAGLSSELSCLSLFSIIITLTDKGLKHYDHIIQCVFNYIQLIQNPEQLYQLYNETGSINHITFRYKSKTNSTTFVDNIANRMADVPIRYVLNSEEYADFDYDHIMSLVHLLTPQNCVALLCTSSPLISKETMLTEPIYGTQYGYYQSLSDMIKQQTTPFHLHLPYKNAFICSSFDMIEGCSSETSPILIKNEERVKCWYCPCTEFKRPHCSISLLLNTRCLTTSIESLLCAQLLIKILKRQTITSLYDATLIGYKYDYDVLFERGFHISINGFNERIQLVLMEIISALLNITITEEEYQDEYAKLCDVLHTAALKEPYSLIYGHIASLLLPAWSVIERDAYIHNHTITLNQVKQFAKELVTSSRFEWLVVGNMKQEDVESMIQTVKEKVLNSTEIASFTPGELWIRQVHQGQSYIHQEVVNTQSVNCGCCVLWQFPLKEYDHVLLFDQCINEYIFHLLRTVKQMGYVVWSFASTIGGMCSFVVIVQSNSFTCKQITEAIRQCVLDYKQVLGDLTEEAFNAFKSSLCASLTKKIFSVKKLRQRYWNEISRGTYEFQRLKNIAERIQTITKEEMMTFFETYFECEENKHMLILEYGKHEGNEYSPVNESDRLFTSEEFRNIKVFQPRQWREYEEL